MSARLRVLFLAASISGFGTNPAPSQSKTLSCVALLHLNKQAKVQCFFHRSCASYISAL